MSEYVRGPTYARKQVPTFEFKPSSTDYTGGGYARIRSKEYRDHTAGTGTDDVFVSIHRLCAVAWHFPDDWSAQDILESEGMAGMDVHHTLGMPAANGEDLLELVDHGGHSEITQAQVRAWGEDAKQQATLEYDEREVPEDRCDRCGAGEVETMCRIGGRVVCLDCSMDIDTDGPIEVLN